MNAFSKLDSNGNLKLEAYSFVDFLENFQEAIHNGFMLDLVNNEHYPQMFGSVLHCVLVPAGDVTVEEIADDSTAPADTADDSTSETTDDSTSETADDSTTDEKQPIRKGRRGRA